LGARAYSCILFLNWYQSSLGRHNIRTIPHSPSDPPPLSDTPSLGHSDTPPPIRKNSQFFTKHQKPQQNDSFPIKNQKSKIKNPITLPSPDPTGPNLLSRVPHPLAPLCPFKLPAQPINCLHPSPKAKSPDCLIR